MHAEPGMSEYNRERQKAKNPFFLSLQPATMGGGERRTFSPSFYGIDAMPKAAFGPEGCDMGMHIFLLPVGVAAATVYLSLYGLDLFLLFER